MPISTRKTRLLMSPKGFARRGAAVAAVVGLAILGLVQGSPVASASSVSSARSASPAPAGPRTCPTITLRGKFTFGDPNAYYSLIGGYYKLQPDLAFKLTGQFPHSTTFTATAQDDFTLYPGAPGLKPTPAPPSAYTLNDFQITPDRGSVNPFQSGRLVNAPNRNYTMWVWPDSVPVPPGLKNVVLYTTIPNDPTDKLIRWSMVLRQYLLEPGYRARMQLPTIQAVRASNPNKVIPCPLTKAVETAVEVTSFARQIHHFVMGKFTRIPAPLPGSPNANKVYFTRTPAEFIAGPEGFPADGAVNYLVAPLDLSKITVITMHKTPTFFDNQHTTLKTVMGEYQVRYMSMVSESFPVRETATVADTDAIIRPDRSWVTVYLPSEPRLSRSQEQQVRAKAAKLHYNVLQAPPRSIFIDYPPNVAVRYKVPAADFCCSATSVPSWVDPSNPATAHNNYLDWPDQSSPAFFARYASNPANQGPFWVGGVKDTFAEFING